MLKHRTSKACYHQGDLEKEGLWRLMPAGVLIFPEIGQHLKVIKPNNVSNNEIDEITKNYANLCHLMDNMFSILHSKRGGITDEKINALKDDLNLVRMKWHDMGLSYTPKFHVLHEHAADFLLTLNGFYDMGEDAIERWHQIRLKHHARIRSLRNMQKQKNDQAKCQEMQNNSDLKEITCKVNNNSKRKFKDNHISKKLTTTNRKKAARTATRNRIKTEVEQEDRKVMPTPRERQMQEYKNNHNL